MHGWLGRALFFGGVGLCLSACSTVLGIEELPAPKDGGTSSPGASQFCAAQQLGGTAHLYCADFDEGLRTAWSGPNRQQDLLLVTGDPSKTSLESGALVTNGTTVRLEAPAAALPTLDVAIDALVPSKKVTLLRVVFRPKRAGASLPEVHVSLWVESYVTLGVDVEKKGGGGPVSVNFPIAEGRGVQGNVANRYRILVARDLTLTAFVNGVNILNDAFVDLSMTPVPFDVIVGAVDTSEAESAVVRIDNLTVDVPE